MPYLKADDQRAIAIHEEYQRLTSATDLDLMPGIKAVRDVAVGQIVEKRVWPMLLVQIRAA